MGEPEYSIEELRSMNEAFWQSNGLWLKNDPRLPCCRCGALASIVLVDSSPPELHIDCPRCQAFGIVSAVDDATADDLPLTTVAEVVDRHHSGLDSYCPVCRTLLTVEDMGGYRRWYLVKCPRCQVSGQTV